jgi:hypothetical protein
MVIIVLLINILENIDPNVNDIVYFPRRESFGVESDLLINRNYLFHF